MKIVCPVCSFTAGEYKVKKENFSIYKCSNCGLEYTNPIPTDDELKSFYSRYSDIRADSTIVKLNAKNNLNRLLKYGLDKNSLVLDFGSGNGEFVDIAGSNCYGIELGETKHKNIYNSLDNLPFRKFDFITLWGVLEHINNINTITKELLKYLKKDGFIVITTVDAEGSIPYYHKPPEHLTYWTKKSLFILSELLECKVLDVSEYRMKQFSHIYLDRLLSRTPDEYAKIIKENSGNLPNIIDVPTNEFFAVLQKR